MNDEFLVSLFKPEDAPGISRLYREMYGDDFPIRYIYDPAEIVRRYDGMNHRAAVVHDGQGALVGLGSLFRSTPNPLLYEAGQLMVAKKHRGKSVASLIGRVVFEEFPSQIPVNALFFEALCSHTISQHVVSGGSAPTGVELEWLPATAPDKDGGAAPNISLLLIFCVFKDTPHVIYSHPVYSEFVMQCVCSLGLERTLGTGALPAAGATECRTDILAAVRMATLSVSRIGPDWPGVLARFEAETTGCARHVRVNLGDPAVPWSIDVLRSRGFFLGGYLPLWFETDGMLFQKLPTPPDFSVPRYGTEEARNLAEVIRADWETVSSRS